MILHGQSVRTVKSAKGQVIFRLETDTATFGFMSPFSYEGFEEFEKDTTASDVALEKAVRASTGKPMSKTPGSPSSLDRDPVLVAMMRSRIEEPFQWALQVVRTTPRSKAELFFMSSEAFQEYLLLAFEKATNGFSQRGLLIVHGKTVDAIVHLGSPDPTAGMFAAVYDRNSNVQQGISVRSTNHQESRKALLGLLSGLRYTLTKVPDRPSLVKLVHQEIEKHSFYLEYTADK